jgi:carbon monoxide dehydrogenase subunit G
MRLEQSFEVPVPVAQAWTVLLDVERIAPCMPGAAVTSFDGTAFSGTVKVKLGPVSLSYQGRGEFVERDEAAGRVVLVASGQDTRGAGGASVRVTAHLREAGDSATFPASTHVDVVADLDIAGRAAQFGRGMIADVSAKLVKQFAACLATTIAAAEPSSAPTAVTAPDQSTVDTNVSPALSPSPASPRPATSPAPPPTATTAAPTPTAPAAAIDLLALTGLGGTFRRAMPYTIAGTICLIALLTWLFLR